MKRINDYSLKTLKKHRAEAIDGLENSEIGTDEYRSHESDVREIEAMLKKMYGYTFPRIGKKSPA